MTINGDVHRRTADAAADHRGRVASLMTKHACAHVQDRRREDGPLAENLKRITCVSGECELHLSQQQQQSVKLTPFYAPRSVSFVSVITGSRVTLFR